jgi:hypothetical protein
VNALRAPGGDAKAVTFAAVLVLLSGCIFVFRADEARIGERVADDRSTLAQLASAERTLRARPELERERGALHARLRKVDLDGDRTAIAARFVRDGASIAARHHTTIAAIAAVGPTSGAIAASAPAASSALTASTASVSSRAVMPTAGVQPAPGQTPPAADAFEPIPLDVTVEGRYADVLATIAALSAARVPTVVDVASLARKQAGSSDATVSAQLHVVIQHLIPTTPADAATRPA